MQIFHTIFVWTWSPGIWLKARMADVAVDIVSQPPEAYQRIEL